jgi:hypothetical protein
MKKVILMILSFIFLIPLTDMSNIFSKKTFNKKG